jgi:hypothetical protein
MQLACSITEPKTAGARLFGMLFAGVIAALSPFSGLAQSPQPLVSDPRITDPALEQIEEFCKSQMLHAQCEILKRRILELRTTLAVKPADAEPSTPSDFMPMLREIDSVVAQARTLVLPRLTKLGGDTIPNVDDCLARRKAASLQILCVLSVLREEAEGARRSLRLHAAWKDVWNRYAKYYWLSLAAAMAALIVYGWCESSRARRRWLRINRIRASLTLAILVTGVCPATADCSTRRR